MKGLRRLASGLLSRALRSSSLHDGILGDLEEEYSARAAAGPLRASFWYVRAALGVALRYRLARMGPRGAGTLGRDLRHGARAVGRRPGFSAVVVLTLALGIGANTAVFTVLETVLLRPLPYEDPGEVLQLWVSDVERGISRWGFSLHELDDWTTRTDLFESAGAYVGRQGTLTGGDRPERVAYALATSGVFEVLGVSPALGRTFAPNEDQPGQADVVLLSHDFWTATFAADPDVVGRALMLDGVPRTVVGVMPEGFYFPGPGTRFWKPFGMVPADEGERGGRWVSAVGRLADDRSLASAREELGALADALAAEFPDANGGMGTWIEPRAEFVASGTRTQLWVTLGVVTLVLLMAGTNVANLLLSRGHTRRRELAVRTALGAGTAEIRRLVLAEALVYALIGGLLGLGLAQLGLEWFRGVEGAGLPRMAELSLNSTVLTYALALTVGSGLLFGWLPAARAARVDPARGLKSGGSGASGRRLREGLVVVELALAVVVLVGSGLLIRTFSSLGDVEPGFQTTGRVAATISPAWDDYPERENALQLFGDLVARLEAVPGVLAVSAVNAPPLAGVNMWQARTPIRGETYARDRDQPVVRYRTFLPGYFELMGIPLLEGRLPTATDDETGPPVVVVSRTTAERWFGSEGPIGRGMQLPGPDPVPWSEVIGVVGDVHDVGLAQDPAPLVYVPMAQAHWGHFGSWQMTLVAEVTGPPEASITALRQAAADVVPTLPLFDVAPLDRATEVTLAPVRFNVAVLTGLGVVGLLLAAIGVYGVIAFTVGLRTKEIGMRIALGASRGTVLRSVVIPTLRLALVGLALGTLGAAGLARWMESLLFGVGALDAATFGGAAAVLLVTAGLACALPARRAVRLDPMVCFREE